MDADFFFFFCHLMNAQIIQKKMVCDSLNNELAARFHLAPY